MTQFIAYVFGVFGVVTILVVIYRFYVPKTIPPKSDMATLSIFGGRLSAPVAGILGSAWLLLAFGLFAFADHLSAEEIVASAVKEVESCRGEADSLRGAIADLEIELVSAAGSRANEFTVSLRFGLWTPLTSLGPTVEAGLRGTKDNKKDLIEISGAISLSHSPDSGFETVPGIAAFDYRNERTAYVKLENGNVWRVSHVGLNAGTGLNRFRFSKIR